MRFLYSTDLHGNITKYTKLLYACKRHDVKLLHIGSDLLPKGGGILSEQKKFINGFLKRYYDDCSKQGIKLLASFGNDDIYSRKKYFKTYANLLDETSETIDGFNFQAYSYVPDYPFGLKTACKLDYDGWSCPDPYIGKPIDIGPQGPEEIKNVQEYFKNKGTIEKDLDYLKVDRKSIVSIHCPPSSLNLDVCYGNRRVGSRSVYNWIEKTQPLMTLHGHIHESPECTGEWKAAIKDTLVIQPGQTNTDKVTYVFIEVDSGTITTYKCEI